MGKWLSRGGKQTRRRGEYACGATHARAASHENSQPNSFFLLLLLFLPFHRAPEEISSVPDARGKKKGSRQGTSEVVEVGEVLSRGTEGRRRRGGGGGGGQRRACRARLWRQRLRKLGKNNGKREKRERREATNETKKKQKQREENKPCGCGRQNRESGTKGS